MDIKEGSTGIIMPGVGVSSDSGVIGRLVYRQRNFDITDWPDDPSGLLTPWKYFKGAGQSFSVTLEPGTEYSQYYVEFVDPYWRDRPMTFDVLGRSWERYRESYDERPPQRLLRFRAAAQRPVAAQHRVPRRECFGR